MSGQRYGLGYRVSRAVLAVVFNLAVWVAVPMLIQNQFESALPSSPLEFTTTFVYTYGIVITALQAMGALTMGMALSVPFVSGSYLAEAYYLWTAVKGGTMAFTAAGLAITITFPTLLVLLLLPSLFGAVKAPLTYFLEQTEASAPAPDSV